MVRDWCVVRAILIGFQGAGTPHRHVYENSILSWLQLPRALKASSTSQRSGVAEFVFINDSWANPMIQFSVGSKRHEGPIFHLNAKMLTLERNELGRSW